MAKPVCVVAGVGPGNGLAISQRFAQADYQIAMLARQESTLEPLQAQVANSMALPCDLTESRDIAATFARVKAELGPPDVLIYNAGSGLFGAPLDTRPEDFTTAWRVNALGLLLSARQVAPDMISRGGGCIIVTGATASLRGGANFTAFASAKAAQRNLAQSLSRSLGPQGVHVALVIVDGIIDTPRTRELFGDKPDATYLKPAAIAESVFQISAQDRSAWTFELDLRPSGEAW